MPSSPRRATASLWRLRPYLRPFRGRFVVMGLSAAVGIVLIIVVPLVTRRVVDGPLAEADRAGLWSLGLFALGLGVVEALVIFVRRWTVSKATNGVEFGIRTDLYAKLQGLPMAFHSRWQSGQLLSRIMNDLSTIRRFLGFGLVFLITNIVQIAVTTAVLIYLYAPLGLVVAVCTVPVVWICLRLQRRFTTMTRAIQDQTGDVASTAEESAYGLRVIKAFGRSSHLAETFDRRSTGLRNVSLERVRLSSLFWTFLEIVPSLTLIVVLGVGAYAVGTGAVTLGTLVAFITLMLSMVWPVASLGFLLSMGQEAMTAADRVWEIFDAHDEIPDGDRPLAQVQGRLTFDHASFRFADAETDTLHDLVLDIAPGETIALVGATGSGKTTLTALVPRLFDVTGGAIRLDGVDLRELPIDQLRTVVAMAFEDPTLFSMSARENLTLGRPDASDRDIDDAIEVAQAHFLRDLPWGLDTRIGEQGMSLSGGQRQRLALARAVLAKPKVLILDDTLSALDIHTEALVEEALRRVLARVTGVVVAHRASTVLLADRVALLQGGTITHVGTHAELLATVPAYRELLAADCDPGESDAAAEWDTSELDEDDDRAGVSR
ncbi:MAG TPA: ABC transporter ATP-binding protein [Propionibacteriaceae bacterium]